MHHISIINAIIQIVTAFAWPITVVFIICLFRKQWIDLIERLAGLLYRIKNMNWKTGYVEFEEPSTETAGMRSSPDNSNSNQQIETLKEALQNSPHSYNYLRQETPLQLSDEEFDRLINKFSSVFEKTHIIRRNTEGERIIPGWPGIKLKKIP